MLFLLLAAVAKSLAGVRRFAVMVGNNQGGPNTQELYFAETDAQKIHRLLTGLGDVHGEDAALLLGRNRNELLSSLVALRGEVSMASEQGHETVVLFYYSGHADEERLQLGRTWLRYEELDVLLEKTGADVRIALVDACRSGAMTRTKGGKRAPAFDVDLTERLSATGQVVITSSSGDEDSQESDEIGGSYFTHYLASALSGAADHDDNDVVTLAEAYQYVYRETVFRTASSRSGTQHPTFEWDLAGTGDLLLTDLRSQRATLQFPSELEGRFAVFDQNRRQFVAEVDLDGTSPFDLTLIPGTYLVQQRFPTHLEVAEVNLREGAATPMTHQSFEPQEYERDVAKGTIDKQIRQAQRPDTAIHLMSGSMASGDDHINQAYMPRLLSAGVMGRWYWRDRRFASAEIQTGGALTELTMAELPYTIPANVSATTVALSAGYATQPRWYQAGIGVRAVGFHLRRRMPDYPELDQQLFTLAPGWTTFVGLRYRSMELDLNWRAAVVPNRLDGRERLWGLNETTLSLGYRF